MPKHMGFKLIVFLVMLALAACAPLTAQTGQNTSTPVTTPTGTPVPPAMTETPTPGGIPTGEPSNTVTLSDNNQTITLHVNDTFLLKLGNDYQWNIQIDHPKVVSRVVNIMVVRGAQGVYRAHEAGTATLTATGDPTCRQATPPCMIPSIQFTLHIQVLP